MGETCIILWYSNQKEKYYINTKLEIENNTCGYVKDLDNVLYIMEEGQLSLAKKIMSRLNQVRTMKTTPATEISAW